MKTKLILISTLLTISLTVLSANEVKNDENPFANEILSLQTENLIMPYSDFSAIEMRKIISKNEYSLYKCPGYYINNYPTNYITGKSYHYFVYKNGEFHLTVNEFNKDKVYKFFVNLI